MGCAPSLSTDIQAIGARLASLERRATHVLDEKTEKLLHDGALFYLLTPAGLPSCCGFFVGPDIAVTVSHGLVGVGSSACIRAVSSRLISPDQLTFEIVSRDRRLDFAVLRLVHNSRAVPTAYFAISRSSADCSPGRKLAIVSMSLGGRQIPGEDRPLQPTVGVYDAVIRCVDSTDLVYDASTWRGDSGSAVAVEKGVALALHLGVQAERSMVPLLSDFPCVSMASLDGSGAETAVDISRYRKDLAQIAAAVETAILASAHSGKEGRALILSNAAVTDALAAAVVVEVRQINPLRLAGEHATGPSHLRGNQQLLGSGTSRRPRAKSA